jgi:hypothetical protein
MNVVSLALAVALLASLIVNYVLADQLRKAEKKMEEWEDERKW